MTRNSIHNNRVGIPILRSFKETCKVGLTCKVDGIHSAVIIERIS